MSVTIARIILFCVGAMCAACAGGAAYERRVMSGLDRVRLSAWVAFFAVGCVASMAAAAFLNSH